MTDRFQGKVAVITGAAGGIGRATCERFAQDGARVVAVDLGGSALDEVVAAVQSAGGEAHTVEADVTVAADHQRYVAEATERFGGIDIFFNNAGIEGAHSGLIGCPEDEFDRVIAVNLKGVFLGMKYVAPAILERGGGAIVNTASTAGLGPTPRMIAYGASKHAVIGMSASAAVELAPQGIRVNAICPGPIETRMMRSIERQWDPDDPQSRHDAIAESIPLGRYGEPAEVAALVTFLASDDASYINGGVYTVHGGGGTGRTRLPGRS